MAEILFMKPNDASRNGGKWVRSIGGEVRSQELYRRCVQRRALMAHTREGRLSFPLVSPAGFFGFITPAPVIGW